MTSKHDVLQLQLYQYVTEGWCHFFSGDALFLGQIQGISFVLGFKFLFWVIVQIRVIYYIVNLLKKNVLKKVWEMDGIKCEKLK